MNDLLQLRKSLELTQSQFAKLLKVSIASIQSIETGRLAISDKMRMRMSAITGESKRALIVKLVAEYKRRLEETLGI